MKRTSRLRTVFFLGIAMVLVLGSVGCGERATEGTAPETPEAEDAPSTEEEEDADSGAQDADPARALVESKCSGCHGLDQVWAADFDRAGWEEVVSRMETNGLLISETDRATVIDYLAGG